MSIASVNGTTDGTIQNVNNVSFTSISKLNGQEKGSSFSVDYSIDLNGSSQYAALGTQTSTLLNPTTTQFNNTGYTYSAWIYIDSFDNHSHQIFSLGVSNTLNYYGIQIIIGKNGQMVIHVMGLNQGFTGSGSNNRNTGRTPNSTIAAGQWYHVAFVMPNLTRSNWVFYKNGVAQTGLTYSGNQNVTLTYSGSSQIGWWNRANGLSGNYWHGELNNCAIWNDDLNQSNITAIYNSGAPIDLSANSGNYNQSSNLLGWWRFNEGTGTSYTDSSGNGFTGTGVNTPTWSTNVPT
tara:strand:- start:2771 stop:3646 length:876 start_codon:yes stop_codon:yes gene_type:complete